ncbi:zinc finger protein 800 [Spea bombifrons]|uniref:zinc finger protein 800 n=1 Tax=Spea bombifrons TaxID=233779 RepID=UPI00234BC17E|nr:zinc finger protein 800 [Spea bombifrons]
MEKNYITLRKTHFLRNKSKNEADAEESMLPTQKMHVRDKCCQTDHHHHGCCGPAPLLEPGDPPVLQQPVQTAKSGIQQIIDCFRSGTKQLKHMLLKEVDTIFECKTCRSLFRGLPNLITHKQFYCLSELHIDESASFESDKQSQAVKDLLDAIYPRVDKQEYVVNLEPIQTNRNAVFQFVTPVGEKSNIPELMAAEPEDSVADPKPSPSTEMEITEPPATESNNEESASVPDEVQIPGLLDKPAKERDDDGLPFLCRVCKKSFHCRRSIRRHIKKVHKKKLEDIKKFVEVKRKQTRSRGQMGRKASSTSCPMCNKSFATKANVRRHIDEVHKGLKRDSVTPESTVNTKPAKNVSLDVASPKKSLKSVSRGPKSANVDFSLSSCKCPYCKRRYTSQYLLKKHVRIVHKAALGATESKKGKGHNSSGSTDIKVKAENSNAVDSSCAPSLQNDLKGSNHTNEKKSNHTTPKTKGKSDVESPKSSPAGDKKKTKKPKLSVGFDFKQLYCKLCKRQFTSKQNLTKHISLHTDGNNIYVKFYRCPLCSYETRRKRDVIRHITVVHKKTQRALVKITANLESRAIKKPIECILEKVSKRGPQKYKAKRVNAKHDGNSILPNKKGDGESSIEVKVTKNFSLLKCKKCGKAFAKKTDLDLHKKVHKAGLNHSSAGDSKNKGRSTRSKTTVG